MAQKDLADLENLQDALIDELTSRVRDGEPKVDKEGNVVLARTSPQTLGVALRLLQANGVSVQAKPGSALAKLGRLVEESDFPEDVH